MPVSLQAVLLDFDGTIVDTTELIHQSMRHATSEVLGKDLSREELLANVGQPLPRQMELLDPDRAEDLLKSYLLHNEEHHGTFIREFSGVGDALARLRGAGLRLAVVTSKRRPSVEMALSSFPELRGAIDVFVTMENTSEHKPHPAPLLRGLKLLGDVSPGRAVYVGDAPFDVAAARAAAMTSIAVSWGAFTEEALRSAGPDHLFRDFDSVTDFLLDEGPEDREAPPRHPSG